MAFIFRGSKFSEIAVLKEFTEKNLWMHVACVSSGAKISADKFHE